MTEDILPFTTYEFQVSLCNVIGCGRFSEMINVKTEEDGKYGLNLIELILIPIQYSIAPDAAPVITESDSLMSTSIFISWNAPAQEKQNGILRDYVIYYTNDAMLPMHMWQTTSTPNTNITLTDLSIFTEYNILVAASTEAGIGPYDSATVKTLSDSKSK